MDTSTIAVVLGAVVLLLIVIGIFIGRKRSSRNHLAPSIRSRDNVPRHRSTAVPRRSSPTQNTKTSSRYSEVEPHIAVTETVTVQKLEAKLLVRLSRDQMTRNKEFERQRNPHLDEIALLEKMLYDLERGR